VNIIGDQATYHRGFDAPLTSDIEGWARPVSVWTRTARAAESVGLDAAAAVQAAREACGIATLILPSNVSWNKGGVPARPFPVAPPSPVAPATIAAIARVLRTGDRATVRYAVENWRRIDKTAREELFSEQIFLASRFWERFGSALRKSMSHPRVY
jgi:thiamine pyrophosphate-dependent acetolactate synthase large subunit-like protein